MSDHAGKRERNLPDSGAEEKSDKAALEAEPNWDRMGQIAKRLMETPPGSKTSGASASSKPRKGAMKR